VTIAEGKQEHLIRIGGEKEAEVMADNLKRDIANMKKQNKKLLEANIKLEQEAEYWKIKYLGAINNGKNS
jgi:hypothetical protein